MLNMTSFLLILTVFAILALSAERIGDITARFNLPRITGYLLTGIVVGPFVLNLITRAALPRLLFIAAVSLGLIAFAAGSELYFPELKSRLRSILWVVAASVVVTMAIGITATLLLANRIAFLQTMSLSGQIAVAVLIGALLIARSPSSAIAIINELRAKGPFTQIVMGVTVAIDVVVIVIFAISISIADALITNVPFNPIFFLLLLLEFALAILIAYGVYFLLDYILAHSWQFWLKVGLVLLIGYSTFLLSSWLRNYSHKAWDLEILVEPLLICMIAGLLVNNRSAFRAEFHQILHDIGPTIYVVFFTLTGASLEIDLLGQVWVFALIFFVVRLIGVAAGAWVGGTLAGEPPRFNRMMWLAFLTQAGVALGLAKEVAVEFPDFGGAFATLIVAVVIINQFIGPPIFKYVVTLMGESRVKAQQGGFDGVRDAIIVGLNSQSVALARRLQTHKWQVK
ncbi:MAG TPA: potassium transporter TrkA, partial [Anaerolineae bacterium]|nr:potassium transporter TrkA [Anaerolineae bacterium]